MATAIILFAFSASVVVEGGWSGVSAEPFPSASSSADVNVTEPSFSVDPDRQEGRPGDRVTLSFASNDNEWVVLGCNAAFSGVRQNCPPSGLDPSVELSVPADAPPGPTSISWTLFYTTAENAGGTHDALPRQDGITSFLVLPPPGGDSPDPGVTGPEGGGGGGSASQPPISVPPALPPALPPGTAPTAGSGSLPIGIPLIFVVLAAAALAAALIGRRIRAGSAAGALAAAAPPAGQNVRVVPHPEPGVQVTVREAPPGLTHVVRLEPRTGIANVNVQEGPK
ncbi:MAG TPA: hypothetical protein VGD53_28565 [Actinoallomurus sp.]|jgi:hypothetical protein